MSRCKILLCLFFVGILFAGLMAGCSSRGAESPAISDRVIGEIQNCSSYYAFGKSAMMSFWYPRNKSNTLAKIVSWLRQTQPYTKKIPAGKQIITSGGGVPELHFNLPSGGNEIIISPANYIANDSEGTRIYVTNVLKMDNVGQISYIRSKALFQWLKGGKWETEFTES